MLSQILRIIFHVLPILPFVYGYTWIGLATLLLVGLAYVKVFKLEAQLKEGKRTDLGEIAKARDFWAALTFLPRGRG